MPLSLLLSEQIQQWWLPSQLYPYAGPPFMFFWINMVEKIFRFLKSTIFSSSDDQYDENTLPPKTQAQKLCVTFFKNKVAKNNFCLQDLSFLGWLSALDNFFIIGLQKKQKKDAPKARRKLHYCNCFWFNHRTLFFLFFKKIFFFFWRQKLNAPRPALQHFRHLLK